MILLNLFLAGLGIAIGGLILMTDWRVLVALLLLVYGCAGGIVAYQPFVRIAAPDASFNPLLVALLLTGLIVTAVLGLTGRSFALSTGLPLPEEEPADELLASPTPSSFILHFWALMVAVIAAVWLGRWYVQLQAPTPIGPDARHEMTGYAWAVLVVGGVGQVLLSRDLLKLGTGLLLLMLSAQILMIGLAEQVQLLLVLLLNVASILLALGITVLSTLLHEQRQMRKRAHVSKMYTINE